MCRYRSSERINVWKIRIWTMSVPLYYNKFSFEQSTRKLLVFLFIYASSKFFLGILSFMQPNILICNAQSYLYSNISASFIFYDIYVEIKSMYTLYHAYESTADVKFSPSRVTSAR